MALENFDQAWAWLISTAGCGNPDLGDARPAMTLIGIAQLAQPALRLEVEVIAAKHD